MEGSVGGGASLKGCPGLILLSKQGQAIWVAPRNPPGGGRAVDLEYPEMSSEMAAKTWRAALLDVRGIWYWGEGWGRGWGRGRGCSSS